MKVKKSKRILKKRHKRMLKKEKDDTLFSDLFGEDNEFLEDLG